MLFALATRVTKRTLTSGALLACLSMAAGAALILLSGCRTLLDIQNPRYSFRDIRPQIDVAIPLSASSIDFDFTIEVDNPNPVGLRLHEIDFDLFVNGTRILDSVSQQNIRIPANGRGDVHLRTRVGYQNLRAIWGEVLDMIRGERPTYEIRGNAYYQTPLGRLRFPVTVYSR